MRKGVLQPKIENYCCFVGVCWRFLLKTRVAAAKAAMIAIAMIVIRVKSGSVVSSVSDEEAALKSMTTLCSLCE